MTKYIKGRREFVKHAGCAALGVTTLWNSVLNLNAMNALTAFNSSLTSGSEYKALVCILLRGGIDSYNLLIPTTEDAYAKYANTRSNLALPNYDCNDPENADNIRPLGDCTSSTYGVHPLMKNVQSLYNQGKLAFISNVGSLIEKVTKQEFYDNQKRLPLGLFSHSDMVAHWQTALPNDRVATGWGGKMADLLIDANQQKDISMNLSFAGSNLFQTGVNSVEYALEKRVGSTGLSDFGEWVRMEAIRKKAVDNMIDATYQDIFKKTYINTIKSARDGHEIFSSAFAQAHRFRTEFKKDNVAQTLKTVAETISVQKQLKMNRQIFFVEVSGWDSHDGLGDKFNGRLERLDNALGSFQAAIEELGMEKNVTTFSTSEFGRTLTSNGNGSDHAWGGNMFVLGGAVNGGQLYGDYPSLELDNELEIGGGVLIPTLSADEYFAEIARWFGVMDSDLTYLFPNINNFYNVSSGEAPIGFLNMK